MKIVTLALVIGLSCPIHAQQASSSDIEIVESTPVGTALDNPDIRNAHEVWLEMIGRAYKTLYIEQFYVSNEPGKPLEDRPESRNALPPLDHVRELWKVFKRCAR